jgi:hypothetical protein
VYALTIIPGEAGASFIARFEEATNEIPNVNDGERYDALTKMIACDPALMLNVRSHLRLQGQAENTTYAQFSAALVVMIDELNQIRLQSGSQHLTVPLPAGLTPVASIVPAAKTTHSTPALTPAVATPAVAPKSTATDSDRVAGALEEMAKQFAEMRLEMMQARVGRAPGNARREDSTQQVGRAGNVSRTNGTVCIFCDAADHNKASCPELTRYIQDGKVALGPDRHIYYGTDSDYVEEKVPPNFGRGGMKALVDRRYPAAESSNQQRPGGTSNAIRADFRSTVSSANRRQ